MTSFNQLTVPEKILLAALKARERNKTFTAEDLVVEAWKLYPDTFGLAGYSAEFPDSNRVLTNIMGTKGLRGKGWLQKVGEKQYRLTAKGLSDGEARLGLANQSTNLLRAELDRQKGAFLERIVTTTAARKALGELDGDITFNDACGFWDITSRSNANTLVSKLSDALVILERARGALRKNLGGGKIQISNHVLSGSEIDQLIDLHKRMQEEFKPELDVIRRRRDERLDRKRKRI